MVRCTICGAVFSDDLTVCPICGQGPAFFVPVEPEPAVAKQDTDEVFLILGGGPAGTSAAETIREHNATATITLLTDEAVFPYNRPMLTKAFDADHEDLPVHPIPWYAEHGIEVRCGEIVTRLDAAAKEVTLKSGETLSYASCPVSRAWTCRRWRSSAAWRTSAAYSA